MIGFSERRQCMITAAANSEKLLTRLITDALTNMRRSRGRFWVVDGAFSKKRVATTNDARRDLFIWCLRAQDAANRLTGSAPGQEPIDMRRFRGGLPVDRGTSFAGL